MISSVQAGQCSWHQVIESALLALLSGSIAAAIAVHKWMRP